MITHLADRVLPTSPLAVRQFSDEVQEYYRTLLRRLDWPGGGRRCLRTLGITSCYGGEGVSTVAAQLAATAAGCDTQRVLLVDGNLNRPVVDRAFKLDRGPGWTDVIVDGRAPVDCVQASRVKDLWGLTAGQSRQQPAQVYDSIGLAGVVEAIAKDFDLVVFDLPTVSEASSAIRMAGLLDGFLLVVEAERTRREVARRTTDQLAQSGAPLLGVVLNKRPQHVPDWLYRTL